MSASASPKRYALVTGCSSNGMGWYVAREFAARGVHVFATLRDASKAGDLTSSSFAHASNITILPLDVTSSESIASCVSKVSQLTSGRLDFLYNNAGGMLVMPIADTSLEAARQLFDVNVWGVLAVTRAFLPLLVAARGHVVNAGSIRAVMLQEYDAIYGASKAAITKISENMLVEFAPLGVRVTCLNIGGVNTEIFSDVKRGKLTLPEGSYYEPIWKQIDDIAGGERARKYPGMQPELFAKRAVGDVLDGKTGFVQRGAFSSVAKFISMLPWFIFVKLTAYPKSGLPELAAMRKGADKKTQ